MAEVMQNILLLSAMGSVLALVLLCIKPLTKRLFSPKWQYYIWLTVLIVMVLPVKLSLSAEPVHITPIENTSAQTQQITPAEAQQESAQLVAFEGIAQRPALKIPDIPNAIIRISGFLWLAAVVLLLGYRIAKYMMFLRTIKKYSVTGLNLENIPKRLTVRKTEFLDSPLIVGIIKPVLYLPQTEIKEDEIDYILLHELTHYRRNDLLYKWFAMLVSSIHWFNPFVYIVSRQIDEECEVSCDYEVCKNLTESQKKDYMAMLLDFVQTSIQKKRPLTTQMASSKKILKRRFLMMKTKKSTGKFVSVLSGVFALAMLSTTVFASGMLSGLIEDNFTVEITNNGEAIELENKPFIENGEVYVPLRETFETLGFMDDERCYMNWDNGKVEFCLATNPPGDEDSKIISVWALEIGRKELIYNAFDHESPETTEGFDNAPVLQGSQTYIPYSYVDFLVSSTTSEDWNIGYAVYDKEGNPVDFNGFYHVVPEEYSIKIPNSWAGKFVIQSTGGKVTFLQSATYEKYGEGSGALFFIEKVSASDAEEILNLLGGSKLLYSNNEYAYIFEVPTDVQYPIWIDRDEEDMEIAAEYERMFAYIDFIASSFTLLDAQ